MQPISDGVVRRLHTVNVWHVWHSEETSHELRRPLETKLKITGLPSGGMEKHPHYRPEMATVICGQEPRVQISCVLWVGGRDGVLSLPCQSR